MVADRPLAARGLVSAASSRHSPEPETRRRQCVPHCAPPPQLTANRFDDQSENSAIRGRRPWQHARARRQGIRAGRFTRCGHRRACETWRVAPAPSSPTHRWTDGKEQTRAASLELRIPSEHFDEAVNGLSPIGKLESVNVNVQDVGEEFVDVQARMVNARRLEQRLIDLLANRTGKLTDVLRGRKRARDASARRSSVTRAECAICARAHR